MMALRFRAIRAHFGLSLIGMSSKVEGCKSLWAQYEGGHKVPSCATLIRLAELGISVDWLLTGKGSMLQPWAEEVGHTEVDHTVVGDRKRMAQGIAQVAQQVETVLGSLSDEWLPVCQGLCGALEPATDGLSLDVLEAKLPQFKANRLVQELEHMRKEGIVGFAQGRYRLLSGLLKHDLNTAEFRSLIAVQELLRVHLPVFSQRSGRGRIDIATIHLGRGAAVEAARRLWRLIEGWKQAYSEQLKGGDSSQLRLVISTVAIEPDEGKST